MYDDPENENIQLRALQSHRPRGRVRAATISGVVVLIVVSLLFYSATIIQQSNVNEYSAPGSNSDSDAGVPNKLNKDEQIVYPDTKDAVATEDDRLLECGDTVATAIERNCPFDVMSNLWTPSHCHDEEFALESLRGVELFSDGGGVGAPEFGLKEFIWFEDAEASKPIHSTNDLEQFLLQRDQEGLPLEAYTSMPFHAAHCSYLARVATRGLNRVNGGESHVWVPEVATNPTHARHCEHVFGELYRMNETEARRDWTMVGFGFSPCVKIG